jgi:hypothetical protein
MSIAYEDLFIDFFVAHFMMLSVFRIVYRPMEGWLMIYAL